MLELSRRHSQYIRVRALRSAVVFIASLSCRVCLAQPACAVYEQRTLRTLSGQFSTGSKVVRITVPIILIQGYPLVVFPEVSDDAMGRQEALFLQSAANRIAVESGAVMQLEPKAAEHVVFTLTDAEGRNLCSWAPAVRVRSHGPTQVPEGFRRFDFHLRSISSGNSEGMFVNAGNPILLEMG